MTQWEDLDRSTLAVLGREWLLHGHLQDRVGMALVMEHADRELMQQIAIEEWMAASPIYSKRMQRALNFEGDGVDTIFKNLQLDIGAPHEFMDFRYRLADAQHGEFWLAHCGALMDVEPMGEAYVHGMCHTIEDPTFDATAAATNPYAQIRPLHRPPRSPSDRTPHCHWRVDIVPDAEPARPHPNQRLVAQSVIAALPLPRPSASEDSGGLSDYGGDFNPDFRLELLSRRALVAVLQEFAVQSHLLLRSFLLSVSQHLGPPIAAQLLPRLFGGWASLTAQRLRLAFELPPSNDGLASMLERHPAFAPRTYTGVAIALESDAVRIGFAAGAAGDADRLTWLGGPLDAMLDLLVVAFHPQARCEPTPPAPGERFAYRAVVDPTAPARPEPAELAIARISTGAGFEFRDGRARLPLTAL